MLSLHPLSLFPHAQCGEALGAIGAAESLDVLDKYSSDPKGAVAETCLIAASRLRWKLGGGVEGDGGDLYDSVDPAPSTAEELSVASLTTLLLDESEPLFKRCVLEGGRWSGGGWE